MQLGLVVPLIRDGELVAGRRLPGAAQDVAVDPGVLDARVAVILERIGYLDEGALVTYRREVPHLVLRDRPAHGRVEVVEMLDARTARKAAASQEIVDVVCLQVRPIRGPAEEA